MDPRARELMKALNKKFGPDTVVLGSDVQTYEKVTTGSLGLDVVLQGGWAANQWHEIIGEASSGKTNLVFSTIAANQKKNPDYLAMFIAAESLVPSYAAMCGVDLDRLVVVETNVMEEAYTAAIDAAESKAVDLIAIDSLPALTPMAEDEKEMDENTVGQGARQTGKFFRKINKAMKRSMTEEDRPIVGLAINQYRMKIGVMHGDPRTTPLGEAKNYWFFSRVEVKRDEWIEAGTGKDKERIGQVNRARTLKCKAAPQQRQALYDIYFDEGGPVPPGQVDYAKEIVNLSILFGIVERAGAYYRYAGQQWQGQAAYADAVRGDLTLFEDLEREVHRMIRSDAA